MTEENLEKKWNFAKPADFVLPEKAVTEKARFFMKNFWQRFASADKEEFQVDVQAELKSVPQNMLDWVAPFPDWKEPSEELFSLLVPWLERPNSEDLFRFFVSPPGGGLSEMLSLLATSKGWPVIVSPDYEQLMSNDFSWIDAIPRSSDVPIVIPKLSGVFLRHYNGLEHLRLLIEKLFHSGQRCVVGCNSWLWKYLEVAMHIVDGFSEPFYLQSMSALQLQNFFCDLEAQKGANTTVFRQSDNGSFILPVEKTAEGKLDKNLLGEYESSKDDFPALFLKKLAVESRGIPLVAWALWRNSLKLSPEDEIAAAAKDVASIDEGKTIWVKRFDSLIVPKMPTDSGQAASFLLLFLLIHDGLPPAVIFEVLDCEKDHIVSILHRLKKAGIVIAERGLWRVSWQGYPEVRRFLSQEDYLLDCM